MIRFLYSCRRLWLAGVLALAGALGLIVLLAGVAFAHASYVSSDPAAGAVLAAAPTQVTVRFAENVDPQGSSLVVYHEPEAKNTFSFDAEAKTVSTGQTQFPLSDPKSMTIAMTGDGNGIYAVAWKTVSADDGDQDSGVFFFGVGAGNVLGNGSTTTPTISPGPTTTTSSGVAVWVPILVGILALLVGGGIGAWLARRMTTPGSGSRTRSPAPPDRSPAGKS
ncbi:MAG TPA: copper resistance protein CopC [Ktedonobacterales bacterium]|nr:copper resistance protein CopC [Ktedonobacterales bacterium]